MHRSAATRREARGVSFSDLFETRLFRPELVVSADGDHHLPARRSEIRAGVVEGFDEPASGSGHPIR